MVGVPGKYKGCETCRRRRVKCSNERPFCQKCIASGRECEGYERERVFITGTPASGGRVASHPKKSATRKSRGSQSGSSQLTLSPLVPLTSGWDDHTVVSSQGVEYSVLVSALNARVPSLSSRSSPGEGRAGSRVSLAPYGPADLQPSAAGHGLHIRSQCLAHLPADDERDDSAESYCIYFFELASSMTSPGPDTVERADPSSFAYFPNHHFFVRVYRPLAASYTLLNRRETFLSSPEWLHAPWAMHPKSLLDQMLDLLFQLPPIIAQADAVMASPPTLGRRRAAQDLLASCLSLERQFSTWYHFASSPTNESPYPYWVEESSTSSELTAFPSVFMFRDSNTGMAFLYYWMTHILFHRCIEQLHRMIFQQVIDAFPNVWPELPPELHIDVTRYQRGRDFASNICRGLDSVLDSTVQPDIVVGPITTAMEFYRELNTTTQDGLMEMVWLDGFRSRLVGKGQYVANVLQSQWWTEVASFS